MDALSPQDATFLNVEDDVSHMHIGTIGIFEGPPPTRDELGSAIASKLHLVPRYRQRVRYPPLRLGQPGWVDDSHFNLDYHVRRTGLAHPGDEAELRRLVGRVMSQQLDRAKPLWEMWAAEGLDDGRWALVSKVHHCMVDGVASIDLLSLLFDAEADPIREPAPPWTPTPEPSGPDLLKQIASRGVTGPLGAARGALGLMGRSGDTIAHVAGTARGAAAMRGMLRPTPRTSLNGPLGPHRRWDWASADLREVKKVRAAVGGTVNDVVLAVITHGFRQLLISRGEDPASATVRTLVPVSVRRPNERGVYNNRVSAMFARLPVELDDPVEQLAAVTAQMEDLKRSQQAVAAETLTSLSGFAPPLLLTLGTRVAFKLPQRSLTTVTTNVPGPQHPLYLAGRRMLEALPYVPLAGQVRTGVAIFSYDGGLKFGVTADYDSSPDIRILCDAIEQAMSLLLTAAGGRSGGPKKPRTSSGTRASKQ